MAKVSPHDWKSTISSFAIVASDYKWEPFDWLLHINKIIQREVLKGGARIIINAPPRHGKSINCSKWLPTWYLENFPDKRCMIASYQSTFAAKWGGDIREEFKLNPKLTAKLNPNKQRESEWELVDADGRKTGGGLKTAGVDGGLTGWGGNLVIIDDPIKDWKEAYSETYRRRLWDWWESVLRPRLEPNANIIIIMTRWAPHDLTARLLESESGKKWTHINLPAEAHKDDWLGRAVGEPLCPERYPIEALREIRVDVGPIKYAGQYLQEPSAQEGNIFKREWFKKRHNGIDSLPPDVRFFQSWDLTLGSITDGASGTVGQLWAVVGRWRYLVDEVRGVWRTKEQARQVLEMHNKYPMCDAIVFEAKAGALAVEELLEDDIGIIVMRQPKGGSKVDRAIARQGEVESGSVILPKSAPWLKDWLDEVCGFPFAKKNDRVDTMTQALSYAHESMRPIQIGAIRDPEEVAKTQNNDTIISSAPGGGRFDMNRR